MSNTLLFFLFNLLHPFYVSVTSIEHNKEEKKLEISCRIFFDDLEDALAQKYQQRFSLIKPKDPSTVNRHLASYLLQNLAISINGTPSKLEYLGYEIEEDAAWCYVQAEVGSVIQNITINNKLLYQSHKQQSNILHVTINGIRKSTKLDYPKSKVSFSY
ncbi:DUF6702 family protein [Olivibacter sp. XZL3]|uniref:DUF6702 family protein n=1 Tax=Olivibacter sp. XZL3 TaxID=1735116 RepID=UPI001065D18D|nr:DUF6702 family protein [Olivibacter sp. XZL3]